MSTFQIILISVASSVFITVTIGVFAMRSMSRVMYENFEESNGRYKELVRIVLQVKKTMMDALIRDTQLFDNVLEDWSDEVPAVVPDEEGEPDEPEQTDTE